MSRFKAVTVIVDGLSRMTTEIKDVGEGVSFEKLGSNLTKGVYPIWRSQRDVQVV